MSGPDEKSPGDDSATGEFDDTAGTPARENPTRDRFNRTGDMLKPTVEEPTPEAPPTGPVPREHATGDMLVPTVVVPTPEAPPPAAGPTEDATEETATPTAVVSTPAAQAQRFDAAAAIDAPQELSPQQQLAIVAELRQALGKQLDDKGRHELRRLLRALRRRPEVTYAAVVEVDAILATDTDPYGAAPAPRGPTPAEAPTTTYRLPSTEAPTTVVRMPPQWPQGAPGPAAGPVPGPTPGPRPPLQQPMRPPSWPPPQTSGPLPAQMGQPPMYQPPPAKSSVGVWVTIVGIVLILVAIAVLLIVVLS